MPKSTADIINLNGRVENALRANDLKAEMDLAVGAVVMMQAYAAQASQQADIDPKALGEVGAQLASLLVQHQASAKRNATFLLSTVAPGLITSLTDVIAYGKMVDAFSSALLPLVRRLNDDPSARGQIQALLAQLDFEIGTKAGNARALSSKLNAAVGQARADVANLAQDRAEAENLIQSDKGELAQIQQKIAETHQKIGGEIAAVVISALVTTGGLVTVGIGALATFPTAGTGASVVLAGVGLTATGVGSLVAAASALANDNDSLARLYGQAAALNTTLTLVGAFGEQVKSVASSADEMAASLGSLTTEWSSIQTGVAIFRDSVAAASDATDVAHLTTGVILAQNDWASITQQAQALLARLTEFSPKPVGSVTRQAAA